MLWQLKLLSLNGFPLYTANYEAYSESKYRLAI
jgi:hypothetical protein